MPASKLRQHAPLRGTAALSVMLAASLWIGAARAALPSGPGPSSATSAPSAPSSAAATPPQATDPRTEALESLARAQPLRAADEAATLAAGLAEADPVRLHALALRATLLAGHNRLDAAEQALRPLQALAQQLPLAAAASGWARAMLESRRGPRHRADRLLTEALQQLPADAPGAMQLHMLAALARLKEDTGHLDDALRLRQQAVRLADAQGVAWRRSEARTNLAYTLLQASELDAARRTHREGLALAQGIDDPLALANAWNIAAFLHDAAGDPAGELQAMQATIAQARRGGSRQLEVLGMANLSDHYLKRGQYAVALAQAREALPLARGLGDANSESVALSNIGLALVSMHRLDEGQTYLREALALEERAGADGALALLIEEQGGYLERAGYLREAFASYQRLRPLSDALARRTQQEAVIELQERFDSERQQRELDLLQREGQLRESQLHKQTLQRRLWLGAAAGGALLLAVGAVLLQRLHRQRRRLVAGNALLLDQSERDPLTGLANRRHLLRRMGDDRAAAAQAEDGATGAAGAPGRGLAGALLLIDLDHFKQINDRHGHASGDAVLVTTAQRLSAALRHDDLLLRWGGEEFLVLAATRDAAALDALAHRLLDAIGATPVALPSGDRLRVTASLGFAGFPLPPVGLAPGWEQALDLVDSALYLAKSHGRNRACGVRSSAVPDLEALRQVAQQLEQAQATGRVLLTHLPGPGPAASGPDTGADVAPAAAATPAAFAADAGPARLARPASEAAA